METLNQLKSTSTFLRKAREKQMIFQDDMDRIKDTISKMIK